MLDPNLSADFGRITDNKYTGWRLVIAWVLSVVGSWALAVAVVAAVWWLL